MDERNCAYKIIANLAVLGTDKRGWKKELNIVKWNEANPKLDIREWDPEHTTMTRGMTFTTDEADKLKDALVEYFGSIDRDLMIERLGSLQDEEQIEIWNQTGRECVYFMSELDDVTADFCLSSFLCDVDECFNVFEGFFKHSRLCGWMSTDDFRDFVEWDQLSNEELSEAYHTAINMVNEY